MVKRGLPILLNVILIGDMQVKFFWAIYVFEDPRWWWGGSILVAAFAFLTKRYGAPAPKGSDAQLYHINWNYVFFGMWGPLCIISGVVHSVLWW